MTDTFDSDIRPAGKRGRTKPSHAPELLLHKFRGRARLSGASTPSSYDALHGLTSCGMLGNNAEGDCGPAAIEHARIVKSSFTVNSSGMAQPPSGFVVPTTAHTLGWYHAYGLWMGEPGPAPDQGVDNLSMLSYLFKVTEGVVPTADGMDIQLWAFAEIDASDITEIHQAIIDFKGLIMGACLTDQAEQEFISHKPWTVSATEQIDPKLGHDVYAISYDLGSIDVLTWGGRQKCTIAWENAEEAAGDLEFWAFITQEDVTSGKITQDQFNALLAECKAKSGMVNPNTPTPKPAPVPNPPQPPIPAPAPQPAPQPVPPAPIPGPTPEPNPFPVPDSVIVEAFKKVEEWFDKVARWAGGK